jgi:hypothetical protein
MRAHRRRSSVGVGALGLALSSAAAQNASLPPVRPIGAIVGRTQITITDVQAVRVLSNGRILVNNPTSRRLLLFDSTLSSARAIVGPPGSSVPEYLSTSGVLLAARGDSSFLLNGASKIDVIDPTGNVVRSIAAPPREMSAGDFTTSSIRATGDRQGRVLHIPAPPFFLSFVPQGFVGDTIVAGAEFVPLLRFDPATLRTDTVATIRGPRRRQALTRWENRGRGVAAEDPFPLIGDDWTVMSDGTIAVARLRGYSLDWISPKGQTVSGPSVPHVWAALSTTNKRRIIDSMRVAVKAAHADSIFPSDSARFDSLELVSKANPEAVTNSEGKRIFLGPKPVRLQFVAPTDLPDSMPPFAPQGMVADADDNVWIQNYSPARPGGGIVYDVVNRKGVLVDRVELPLGASVVGFMPGFAFLRVTAGSGVVIAKARVR